MPTKQTMVVVLSLYLSIYLISWAFTSHGTAVCDEPAGQQPHRRLVRVMDHAAVRATQHRVVDAAVRRPVDGVEVGMVLLIIAVLLGLMFLFNWISLI